MTDRLNTIEAALKTQIDANATMTSNFTTRERRFRDDLNNYLASETPVLAFEAVAVDPLEPESNDSFSIYHEIKFVFEIVSSAAQLDVARQKVKQLLSILQDFLQSTSWSYAGDTRIGHGEVNSLRSQNGFRGYAYMEAFVTIHIYS